MLHIFQEYTLTINFMAQLLFKKLKHISQKIQNRRSGGTENSIYETYLKTVMPHRHHICAKSYDMANATMCAYSQWDHELPNWKCALQCCAKCSSINLTDQETYDKYLHTSPSVRFQIYYLIARCTKRGRLPLTEFFLSQVSTGFYFRKINENIH